MMVLILALPSASIYADSTLASCTQYHTVVRGNTLSSIARTYNTTVATLQALNRLSNINIIYVGQRLCVNMGGVQPVPNQPGQLAGTVVNAYWLNVRSGPGVQYPILRVLRRNDSMLLMGRSADSKWLQIAQSPTHTVEWVSAAYIKTGDIASLPVNPSSVQQPITATVVANTPIFLGPGANYATAGSVYVNQNIGIVGKNAGTTWYQIQTDQGKGWVPATTFVDSVKLYLFPVTG